MRRHIPPVRNRMVMYGAISLLLACGTPQSETAEQGPADVESAYFSLSKQVQEEVLGTQVKSLGEMRKELMAKADKDGDGELSDAEKADLRAQWKNLKEQMKAELKDALDTDKDGEVSKDEMKAGLDNLGQKIKEEIQSKHEEIRAAQKAAREKIKEACADARGQGAQLAKPADAGVGKGNADTNESEDQADDEDMPADMKAALEQCHAVAKEEKDKLHAMIKDSLAELHKELDELKGMLTTVETRNETI